MFYTRQFIEDTLRVDRLPEYLYHYTSIETFALILNSQRLRFSRLDVTACIWNRSGSHLAQFWARINCKWKSPWAHIICQWACIDRHRLAFHCCGLTL